MMDRKNNSAKEEICISSPEFSNIRIRTIEKSDIEELRVWKNARKESFFYQQTIQTEQQMEWFEKYSARTDDFIFMILEKKEDGSEEKIGCIGFRFEEEHTIDLYNVLRGKETQGKGKIADAMCILLSWLMEDYDVKMKCDVLANNKAIGWYEKCGFAIESKIENYVIMSVDKKTYKTCMVVKERNYD